MGRLGNKMHITDTKNELSQKGTCGMRLFPTGSVLFTKSGASTLLNQRAILSRPMYVVSHIAVAQVETGVSHRYFYYWLSTVDFAHYVHATTLPSLQISKVKGISAPFPPSAEQTRIADALDELLSDLEAGVTALERVRAKLKHYRAAVLKAAVEGALTAEWRKQHPDPEPASVLLTRILAERRRRWEEAQLTKFKEAGKPPPKNWKAKYKEPVPPDTTGLPPLPRGWCWATVEQLSQVSSGQTPAGMPTESEHDGKVAWYRVSDMNTVGNETWMSEGGMLLSLSTAQSLRLKQFPAGSIIFPKRGGAIATNKKRRLKFSAACDLNIMIVSPEPASAAYLWLFFLSLDLARLSDGSNVPQINNPDILPRVVGLPPPPEQAEIVEAVEDQLSVIEHLEGDIEAKLKSAGALRQSILRHAFSGRLVPQDANDEPGALLLKRIAAERAERERQARAAKPVKKSPAVRRARRDGTP